MPKSPRRSRRRRPAPPAASGGTLLARLLETPRLAQAVPRLQPELLHRVIERCGLKDCGELVALATPAQLSRVFDLDLWRGDRPGLDEELDPARFGVWLAVLMDAGPEVAVEKLLGVDIELVIAGLAAHLRVFDGGAASAYTTSDGLDMPPSAQLDEGLGCEIGGYHIAAKREDAWDAIVALLLLLDEQQPVYFARVMRGCRSLSNSDPEIDGLDDLLSERDQDLFDLALDRERRREKQGYVMPAQARAFLQMARQLRLTDETPPPRDPIAGAYFRAIEWPGDDTDQAAPASREMQNGSALPAAQPDGEDPFAAVAEVLVEAGVIAPPPRALLTAAPDETPRLARIQAHMQWALDRDAAAYSIRTEELAYLANTLIAGCAVQGRPLTAAEASDAVAAICNLGLENWPPHWLDTPARRGSWSDRGESVLPESFLVAHDMISVFQVGWTTLHRQVGMHAAERLIGVLTDLAVHDPDVQSGLDALLADLRRHWRDGAPWRARPAFDVLLILDAPAWAALLGLVDECPVLHAVISGACEPGTRAVSASAFEFISENSQIARAHAFLETLPATLRS